MTDVGHPWVEVAWDVIEPGDVVQGPDGAEWHVTAKIDMPHDPLLALLVAKDPDAPGVGVWTDRKRGTEVMAWRFNDSPKVPGAEAFAIGRLRLGGFDVEVVAE